MNAHRFVAGAVDVPVRAGRMRLSSASGGVVDLGNRNPVLGKHHLLFQLVDGRPEAFGVLDDEHSVFVLVGKVGDVRRNLLTVHMQGELLLQYQFGDAALLFQFLKLLIPAAYRDWETDRKSVV